MSDSETPWSVAPEAPLSMRFPRQEYWNGLPFPSAGYLPDPGIEDCTAGGFSTLWASRQAGLYMCWHCVLQVVIPVTYGTSLVGEPMKTDRNSLKYPQSFIITPPFIQKEQPEKAPPCHRNMPHPFLPPNPLWRWTSAPVPNSTYLNPPRSGRPIFFFLLYKVCFPLTHTDLFELLSCLSILHNSANLQRNSWYFPIVFSVDSLSKQTREHSVALPQSHLIGQAKNKR